MRHVDPNVYDRNYYVKVCLGSDEFISSGGKKLHPRIVSLLSRLPITSNMRVLDVGCGRGDITLHLAKKAKEVVGVDYSKDAIALANETKKKFSPSLQRKTSFFLMNAKKLSLQDDSFDLVVCIDLFEHLYPNELEIVMKELKRVLKTNGLLFVHTGTNRILYNFTYKYYILPISKLLTTIDQKIKRKRYPSLSNDPRTYEEKKQHVNEPTYLYLRNLFHRYNFEGKIDIEIGYLKPGKSIKTKLYNALVTLYPLSKFFPLNTIFGWVFICLVRNKK